MRIIDINNRRYLGNKYKLLPFIRGIVDEKCTDVRSFFDVFAGTGAVASAFTDCRLVVNDLMYSNYIASLAWFSPEEVDEQKVRTLIEYYNENGFENETNYFSENFSGTYFSESVCRKIGYIREHVEGLYAQGEINLRERAILITSLMYGMDKIAATCGHYDAYIRNASLPESIELCMPNLRYRLSEENICLNEDSNVIAGDYQCDVAYLDPPYNSRQYCDAYHLLENVALWNKPPVYGEARKMDRTAMKSKYCQTDASSEFEDLIRKLNARYILMSYNNNGQNLQSRSNAKISDEEIVRILSDKGDLEIFSTSYRPFTTGRGENQDNKERLFFCKVR